MNDTKNPINLADIYRKFHPETEYRLFSSSHGTFSRSDQKLSHKTDLNKFKRWKQHKVCSPITKKLGTNNRKKFGKFTNMWKSNTLLNNQRAKKKLGNTLR